VNRLTGQRALVTGGGRGIGAAIVRRLVAEGASVAINYRSDAVAAEAFAAELAASGGGGERGEVRALTVRADVSDPEQARRAVDEAADGLGGLDILVSNAGVEYFGPLEKITVADYERVFGINVGGQLFITQAAVARMERGARIVLTSSVSASMAAVSAMVRNLAPELAGRGIAINAIAAGGTNTAMAAKNLPKYAHPELRDLPPEQLPWLFSAVGRLAEPEEIAAAVAFLASADASYVTGSTLAVDGGKP
jgi:3-oxoacyl-[acyl-carrier protein] reductase